jgi:hypothetical protein
MGVEEKNRQPIRQEVTDEAIFKVAKEIVVKFIEVGRVSPTSFADTFTMVIDTLRGSLKGGGKG